MKTFLGITTGFFSGAFAGMVFTAALLLTCKEFRDYVNSLADDTDDT